MRSGLAHLSRGARPHSGHEAAATRTVHVLAALIDETSVSAATPIVDPAHHPRTRLPHPASRPRTRPADHRRGQHPSEVVARIDHDHNPHNHLRPTGLRRWDDEDRLGRDGLRLHQADECHRRRGPVPQLARHPADPLYFASHRPGRPADATSLHPMLPGNHLQGHLPATTSPTLLQRRLDREATCPLAADSVLEVAAVAGARCLRGTLIQDNPPHPSHQDQAASQPAHGPHLSPPPPGRHLPTANHSTPPPARPPPLHPRDRRLPRTS